MHLCVLYGSPKKQPLFCFTALTDWFYNLNCECLLHSTNWIFKYSVIQDEMSMFWEVIVSVIVRKESSYEHVSSLNVYWVRTVWFYWPICLRFLFVGLMKSEVCVRNVDTRDALLACFWMPLPLERDVKFNSEEQRPVFAHELQSALRLRVGYSNIYCKL